MELFELFEPFTDQLENEEHRERTREIIQWVLRTFPELETRVAWNQPTFTHHGTFILSFSHSRAHLTFTPEQAAVEQFAADIERSGYSAGKMTLRLPWNKPVDYQLLERIIAFNLEDKKDCTTFWRKPDR